MEQSRRRGHAVLLYTVLRVVLFLGCWLLIQLVSPLRGLLAAALGLALSGVISLLLLDRQRDAMGGVVGSFFSRINERIEAGARAEDDDEPWPSAEGQADTEQQAVGQEQQPGVLENGHEVAANGAGPDDPQGLHRGDEGQ